MIRITTVPVSLAVLLKGQMRFMGNNGFEIIGVSSPEERLQEVAEAEQIRTVGIEMTRTISPIQDLKSLWSFYKLCKKEKPTIVHSHTPKAGLIGMLGAKLAGVPIRLHTVAGLPLMEAIGFKRTVLNWVEKLIYACALKVYPNSKGLMDFILKEKLTSSRKLKIIAGGSSNGINTAHFDENLIEESTIQFLKSQYKIQEADFVFVFVGRLVGDKGIYELIQAFKLLCQENSNVKLLLVGPYEAELDPLKPETLNEIDANLNIISVGYQKDVRSYFAMADALVFPSYREGFPNVVMQAGAMGLPCIVSNINGCNEIIVEGENGIIVPVKNTDALLEAMQKLLNDKFYFEHLKQNARIMIQSRYEQQMVWDALLKEYISLILK